MSKRVLSGRLITLQNGQRPLHGIDGALGEVFFPVIFHRPHDVWVVWIGTAGELFVVLGSETVAELVYENYPEKKRERLMDQDYFGAFSIILLGPVGPDSLVPVQECDEANVPAWPALGAGLADLGEAEQSLLELDAGKDEGEAETGEVVLVPELV